MDRAAAPKGPIMKRACLPAFACLFAVTLASGDDKDFFKPKADAKESNPSGRAEMLRQMPKKFGRIEAKDEAKREVRLLLDGDKDASTWIVNPDAEVKLHGWWARLRDFQAGDRVWVWFDVDGKRQAKSILMLCDELTQQEINDRPFTLVAADAAAQTVTLKPHKGDAKTWRLNGAFTLDQQGDSYRVLEGKKGAPLVLTEGLKAGTKVYTRTAGESLYLLVDAAGLEQLRGRQRQSLRNTWIHDGLPGTVIFLHPLSGEMELMLDHEAIRWGRYLKLGDKVKIKGNAEIAAAVKEVRPWRERTQLRLVVDGFVQHDLTLGQRVHLRMTTPPAEVDTAELPPDLGRPRSKDERVEWFLASTYCSCSVGGNGCTGMFYTLASCNVHACGMPNAIRQRVGEMIDKGLTDKQIWEELRKSQGPVMLRPHLVP
jgi:hypothetical protein